MYKYIFSALIGVLMMACSSASKEGTFSISGKLEGVNSSYFICAVELYADSITIDTIRINMKGEFSYRSKIDDLAKVSLFFNDAQIAPLFVDENIDIKIEGNVLNPNSLKIEGGNINETIAEFREKHRKLIDSNSPLLIDSVQGFLKNNKDDFASVAFLDIYLRGRIPSRKLDSLYHTLSPVVTDMAYSKNVLYKINENRGAELGAAAPSFSIKNTQNKLVKLSDYTDKPVLLSFVENEDSVMLNLFSELEKEIPTLAIVPVMIGLKQPKSKDLKRTYLFDNKGWASDIVFDYNIKFLPYYVLIGSEKLIQDRGELDQKMIKATQKLVNKD